MKNILFLSVWYPHRYDQMAGLFVRKHALAAAVHHRVAVLYFHPDITVTHTKFTQQIFTNNQLQITEFIVYHKPSAPLRRLLKQGWQYMEKSFGRPDIVHCNVLSKSTLLAAWAKRKYHIPYLVTEHWSGYLPENGQFVQQSWLKKYIIRRLAKSATLLLPVSQCLENAMLQNGVTNAHIERIYNVVDEFFYEHQNAARAASNCTEKTFSFLAVNCFDERAKNNKGLLRAFCEARKQNERINLIIVGTGETYAQIREFANGLPLPEGAVHFLGERTPLQVAEQMNKADCMVMFSRYENAPVVISESLAIGLPVLASNVGGIPEMIHRAEIGHLVEVENEQALTEAILRIANQELTFSSELCKSEAQRYRFSAVAERLHEIYERIG